MMSGNSDFTSQFECDERTHVCVVTLTGNFDPFAVEGLQPRVQEKVDAGYRRFVFDLSQLHHIGSLGLRLLVGLHNQVKGTARSSSARFRAKCKRYSTSQRSATSSRNTPRGPTHWTRSRADSSTGGYRGLSRPVFQTGRPFEKPAYLTIEG